MNPGGGRRVRREWDGPRFPAVFCFFGKHLTNRLQTEIVSFAFFIFFMRVIFSNITSRSPHARPTADNRKNPLYFCTLHLFLPFQTFVPVHNYFFHFYFYQIRKKSVSIIQTTRCSIVCARSPDFSPHNNRGICVGACAQHCCCCCLPVVGEWKFCRAR